MTVTRVDAILGTAGLAKQGGGVDDGWYSERRHDTIKKRMGEKGQQADRLHITKEKQKKGQ